MKAINEEEYLNDAMYKEYQKIISKKNRQKDEYELKEKQIAKNKRIADRLNGK